MITNRNKHGLPNGIREHEVSAFTLEHPRGVGVEFHRYERNGWIATKVYQTGKLDPSDAVIEATSLYLMDDVERDGDAVVLNRNEIFE